MLHTLFSFSGRATRLQYFLGSLALIVFMIFVGVALFTTMISGARGHSGALSQSPQTVVAKLIVCVVFILLLLWPSIALTIKRWRDIGFPAWWCFIGTAIVGLLIEFFERDAAHTHIGHIYNFMLFLALVALPSDLVGPGKDESGPSNDGWVKRSLATEAALISGQRRDQYTGNAGTSQAQPSASAGPRRREVASAGPVVFGRRR